MTNEERDLIARFISRVAGSPQGGGFIAGPSGSVPQSQPALPPLDREADAFIAQQFQQYPEARYRITQTALVQEAAFAEAQNRIRRLEWELQQTQQAAQQASQQAPQQQKGFFGSLFGGSGSQGQQQRGGFGQSGYGQQYQPTSAPPPPQYPPNYQPGMFQQSGGSGFLGSALTTAAGVAGGMVVGNALMGAFSGHGGSGGGMFGGIGGGAASTTAFDGAGTDPTAGFSSEASADPFAGGGQPVSYDDGSGFGGSVQQASYDQGGDPGGFDQGGGGFDSGGFDDNA